MRRSASPRQSSSPPRGCCRGFRSVASSAAPLPFWSSTAAGERASAPAGNGPPPASSRLSSRCSVSFDWGWRIPYVFGLLVVPAGLYIRARVSETADFLKAEKPPSVPIADLLRRYPVSLLLALGASIVSNSSYYLLLYVPTYGIKTLHLPAYTGFVATLVGGIVLATFSVVAGYWSDKTVPRTRIMLITAWAFLLAAYPCFWLMDAYPSLATAVFAVGFLNLIKGGYSGVLPSVLSEQFPVETRAVGVALAFNLAVTIFGSFAPFVATWLIAQTGDPLSPSY